MPLIAAALRPLGAGTEPTRITWAPFAAPDPVGASVDTTSAVAAGSDPAPDRSTGARIGGAIRTEAAIEAAQSSLGAMVTAAGWVPGAADGYTASATPAASATGSAPATRVVFLVASTGKPSFCAARGVFVPIPTGALDEVVLCSSLGVPPQPASAKAAIPAIAAIALPAPRRDPRARMRADVTERSVGAALAGSGCGTARSDYPRTPGRHTADPPASRWL